MPAITTAIIRRFKRLQEIEVPLDAVTLLIGANNSGKSSILQAMHFAVSIAQSARLIGENVAWQTDSFELSFNPSQLLYTPVADVLSLATGGTLLEARPSQIEIELRDAAGARCVVGLRRGRNRNIGVSIVGRQLGERLMSLTEPFSVYAPGLAGIAKEERYLSPGVVRRIVARGDANLTLRNVLRMLNVDEVAWEAFRQDMRKIFPGIEIAIDFDENTDEFIDVNYQLPGGPLLRLDAAGTSVLQASQILAYISLFKPQVLILDEPDSHLHPDNQRALCELVFELTSTRGFQSIISTHSRHMLDVARDRANVIWLSKGKKVEQTDFNTTAVLMELGALDSVDYFADGETRCVVATEDQKTEPLKALLWSNNFVEDDTEIASYAGCSKADSACVLGAFLAAKAANVKLVVHRDRDYMSDAAAAGFNQRLQLSGITSFLTELSDIEAYFLNPQHLHHLNDGVAVARIQELLDQATQETDEQSLEAIVNLRTQEAFRRRNEAGAVVNHGQIAVQARADLTANPAAWRRGKIVLKRLSALLQLELQANPRVFFPSEHLVIPALQAAAQLIWPPPGANPAAAA